MTNINTFRQELRTIVKALLPQLRESKIREDQDAFNQGMDQVMPRLKTYLKYWLRSAVKAGVIPSGKYKVEDFSDELYILAYEHIHEVHEDKDFNAWLFKKAHELIEEAEIEAELDKYFFENIEKYSKVEWDDLEEKFTVDGDGDLMPEEELDDPSYFKNEYDLADVFIEDKESEIIEKLNEGLSDEQINRHVNMILLNLATPVRKVFNLKFRQEFSPEEIAYIQRISIDQVETYLLQARDSIRLSFEKRYI